MGKKQVPRTGGSSVCFGRDRGLFSLRADNPISDSCASRDVDKGRTSLVQSFQRIAQ
ncbi:hypothetical protein RMSM_05276 [Rhodopirellula maiorica SM1]|uniref:Uncharacterized protein n=1 Tax=Rhodopirellula maiorica SM1 TaxID=1265738 RepID=M5RV42_9BACT|nr:hypothetical protein RMSM_05276 [Rhodopirellula maiorica SM1]